MLCIEARPEDFKQRFKELGRGGEAVVYRIREDMVAKIFHHPNDPIFEQQPELRAAAIARIREMQTKLFEFPINLPAHIVVPTGVLVTPQRIVFGYVMPFISGVSFEEHTRTDGRLTLHERVELILRLHDDIQQLHLRGIVLGDIKEKNLLSRKGVPYIVDTDPFQFGRYQCRTFDPLYAAPELLKVARIKEDRAKAGLGIAPTFMMRAPHTPSTDWYSFLVVAMRLFTFTGPYGGVVANMELAERLSKRVTVFDPRTIYPRMAVPLAEVPRPLLELFFRVFHLGHRFEPDAEVFRALAPPTKLLRRPIAAAPLNPDLHPMFAPIKKERFQWLRRMWKRTFRRPIWMRS